MGLQFPCVCFAALLAGSAGLSGVDVHDADSAVVLNAAASGHLLVRRDASPPLPRPLGYLPPEKRNQKGLELWLDGEQGKLSQERFADMNMAKHIPADGSCLVIDVGANVGGFTDSVLEYNPACKVIAFEPIHDIFSFNLDTHQANPNIILENMALCDVAGPKVMYRGKDFGLNSFQKHFADDKLAKPENVMCTTLDQYAKEHGLDNKVVNAISIDVVGSEWQVLRGMHRFLHAQGKKPVIAMSTGLGGAGSSDGIEVAKELETVFKHGYQRVNYKALGLHDSDFKATGKNVILLPLYADAQPTERAAQSPGWGWAVLRVWGTVLGTTTILVMIICGAARSGKRRQEQ